MTQKNITQTVLSRAIKTVAPPPKQTVSEWADQKRKLSKEASAEPGQWNTNRAPYQRGILDSVNDINAETIIIESSAQVGKTEILLNIIGYYIDYDPSPILLLQPTLEMAETFSKDRLATMLRDTPALHGKVKDPRARDSGNTLRHKIFPGGHVTMSGANSPASLASRPIRIFLADEVDRYPVSAGSEGDPLSLGGKRTTTFYNRKKVYTSTPTIKDASRIDDAYQKSDMRRYHVPCPHCGKKEPLKWSQIIWDKDNKGRHRPESARYRCEHCQNEWLNHQKIRQMQLGGEWIATNPDPFPGHVGFHLNELYSPWKNWTSVIQDFLIAKQDSEQLKTWTNTSLGEVWEEDGEQADDMALYARREEYEADIPAGAMVLTMAVDVQETRLEIEIVGWGPGEESWNIEYLVIEGDTSKPDVWFELEERLDYQYNHEHGTILSIAATTIDSGYRTQIVYDFCERMKKKGKRIYAIKGVSGSGRPIVSTSKGKKGGASKRQVDLYTIGVDDAKMTVQARLNISDEGAGYCHFPVERDREYFLMLSAEKLVKKLRRGFPYFEWVKTRARNEAFDLRVYNYAGLKILNPNWQAIIDRFTPKEPEPEQPMAPETATQRHIKRTRHKPRQRGFVNRGW